MIDNVWERTSLMVERHAVDRSAWQEKHVTLDDDDDDTFSLPPWRGKSQSNRCVLRHWLDRIKGVKCLLSSLSSRRKDVWQAYAERAQRDGYAVPNTPTSDEIRGSLLQQLEIEPNNESTSVLSVYRDGRLIEGAVFTTPTTRSSSEDETHDKTVLRAIALAYDQVWWHRCIQGLGVDTAFAFALSTSSNSSRRSVSLTLVGLVVPSSSSPSGAVLGGKWPVYEYTQHYTSTPNSAVALAGWYQDIGRLIGSKALPIPWRASRLTRLSPGCMLLSTSLTRNENSLWQVVPTLTGSLVIKCCGREALHALLMGDESLIDSSWWNQLQDLVACDQTRSIWYIKVKTPVFGEYWDTAAVAINSTRRLLHHKKKMSDHEKSVAQEWLCMHPLDTLVEPFRNITLVRSAGTKFVGQLNWFEFRAEFLSFSRRTLTFQLMSHLVHGDIHEGNVLYQVAAAVNHRLVLIDWDEALRKQACIRQRNSEEEDKRYPNELVNFPIQYTKQQILHLFHYYGKKYYCNEDEMGEDWQEEWESHKISGLVASVDERYKRLYQFLEST